MLTINEIWLSINEIGICTYIVVVVAIVSKLLENIAMDFGLTLEHNSMLPWKEQVFIDGHTFNEFVIIMLNLKFDYLK